MEDGSQLLGGAGDYGCVEAKEQATKRTDYGGSYQVSIQEILPKAKAYALRAGVVRRSGEMGAIFHASIFTVVPVAWTTISGAVSSVK